MGKYDWILYAVFAGLAWGTYVPLVGYGGEQLGGKPTHRMLAILCIGIAYLLIGVVFPLVYLLVLTPAEERPSLNALGMIFAGVGGAAGALGAVCVVFATKASVAADVQASLPKGTLKIYIPPIIFGLAPVLATIISVFWHPDAAASEPFRFHLEMPGWKLWAGVALVGLGIALVFYSRGELEAKEKEKQAAARLLSPSASDALQTRRVSEGYSYGNASEGPPTPPGEQK
jgi:drug/metabolite transporter (DMT)-like permease